MGFIGNLVNKLITNLTTWASTILRKLFVNPLEAFVKGLMSFLQDVMVSTPYPKESADGNFPAVTGEPANAPWGNLYDMYNNLFQPYAYLLLFLIILAGVFLNIVGSSLKMNKMQQQNVNSKFFTGFLLVTFWWYIGTLLLATSDALTQLLMSSVAGEGQDPDSIGLASIWDAVSDDFAGGDGNLAGTVMLVPLALLWLIEAIILLIIAMLWVLRMLVIFVLMPVMPIFIAFYTMELPGFSRIQDTGEAALKWFVSLSFVTLPAAIIISVSGRIVNEVLSYGTETLFGGNGGGAESLASYDSTQIIAHPQVGDTVYGSGVAGLGAADPQQAGIVAALGGILFAMMIVIIVPLLAGLAPFILYRSEAVDMGQGAINPAAAAASKAANTAGSVRSAKQRFDESDGVKDEMSNYYQEMEDTVSNGGDLQENLQNNMGATFGAAAGRIAKQTQKRTNQMKEGAEAGAEKAKAGMVRADNAQMMLRDADNRSQVADTMRKNARETVKKKVNPHKQKARMESLGNAPSNARESFADKVQEQQDSIQSRLEARREKKQKYSDMSSAEIRSQMEVKEYTPDDDDLEYLLEQDGEVLDAETKEGMLNEITAFTSEGRKSDDRAVSALNAMEDTVRSGLKGTDIDPEPYLDELDIYRQQIRDGEMTPDEAMDGVLEMRERLRGDIVTDEDVKQKYEQIDEQYEKFNANMTASEYASQSMSKGELKNLPGLDEVIGGYSIREGAMKEALREAGNEQVLDDPEKMAELKQDPERLARLIGTERFNEVSEQFEATEDFDMETAASQTELSRDELGEMDIDDLFEHIDSKFEENGEFNGVSSREYLEDIKSGMVDMKVHAEEEYAERMLKDMVNNAPTTEAAISLVEGQAGVLLEESDFDSTDLKEALENDAQQRGEIVEALDEEDIVSDLIEQEASGEEIQSAISEKFHEEFEDTGEMLENLGQIRESRELVSEISEDIEGMREDTVMEVNGEEITLKELTEDPESVGEKLAGGDLEALQSDDVDVETLEAFGVDASDEDVITSEDISEMKSDAENNAVSTIESQVKETVEESLQEVDEEYDYEALKEELGYEEITVENASEFAREASVAAKSKEVWNKKEKEIRNEVEETTEE